MYFTITIVAILTVVFLAALYILSMLRKVRLKTTIRKTMESGSKAEAAETLLELLRKDPFDTEKRMQAAHLFMEIGNYTEAVVQLNSLLSIGRDRGGVDEKEVNALLARCHMEQGNIDEAYEAYTILRRLDPNDPEPYIALGRIEMQRKNPDDALKYFKKALTLQSENPTVLKEIGIIFNELRRYADALKVLGFALQKSPLDPEIHFYLAEVYNQLENHQSALKHYLKARHDPRFSADSLLRAGKILAAYTKYPEALKTLHLALKTEGLHKERALEIRYEIAEVYLAQGDIGQALNRWERIITQTPDYRDVRAKIDKYKGMKYSSLLKAYMMSTQSDFIKLCQRLALKFASHVVIIRINNERDASVEIFAQGVYRHRNITMLYKFFRGTARVGQLAVREFYEKLRETKATLGVCFTSTEFTEEAEAFVEGRALELYSGARFLSILNRLELEKVSP
jgi:tetratricopeptide (TPR) repeat protein